MNDEAKRISVIIPVLNGARFLQDCIASVCDQSLPPFEVIVVDNNSTDETQVIIKRLKAEKYPVLQYVFESRRTRGAARNAGITAARGDIIAMTDVDCIVPHEWLELLTLPIRQRRDAVVVGSQLDTASTYWSKNAQKMFEFLSRKTLPGDGYVSRIDTKNFAIDAILLKDMLFDPVFKADEDEELSLRLRAYTAFKFLPEVKVLHHHAQTMLRTIQTSWSRSYWFMQLYHKFKNQYDSNYILIMREIPPRVFFKSLFFFDFMAIRELGIAHLPFFIVYDLTWKFARLIGYLHKSKRVIPFNAKR